MTTSDGQVEAVAERVDVSAFQTYGYTLVKGLFHQDEIEALREAATIAMAYRLERGLADVSGGGAVRATGDLLSIDELRGVLLDPRVVGVVSQLLGGQPAYFGDSNVRIGAGGRLGWQCHRDNVDKDDLNGPDWRDPYPLLRCGLYLEDHARHSAGLGLIPGSHRGRHAPRAGRRIVASEVGDLVAWDLRILHTGQMTRFRPFLSLAVPPSLGAALARFGLEVPEERERIALFLTFGIRGDHLTHYIDYLKTRDYARAEWARSHVTAEGWRNAEDAGVTMISVPPYYGPSETTTSA
jgi:Phytanoyl-CoA dioxygenase (PhyH)